MNTYEDLYDSLNRGRYSSYVTPKPKKAATKIADEASALQARAEKAEQELADLKAGRHSTMRVVRKSNRGLTDERQVRFVLGEVERYLRNPEDFPGRDIVIAAPSGRPSAFAPYDFGPTFRSICVSGL